MKRVLVLLYCVIAITIFSVFNHSSSCRALASTKKAIMQNWIYNSRYSDYYINLEKDVARGVKYTNFTAKDFKFREFPVKYWIEPTNDIQKKQINKAVNEFSKYFPMVEVLSKDNADLTIDIISYNEVRKIVNTKETGAYALGGMEVIRKIDKNGTIISRKIRSSIYLLPKTFNSNETNKIILHELCHAFGVRVHSSNPEDVMYPRYTPEYKNRLSESDLNTLWRLYNQNEITNNL